MPLYTDPGGSPPLPFLSPTVPPAQIPNPVSWGGGPADVMPGGPAVSEAPPPIDLYGRILNDPAAMAVAGLARQVFPNLPISGPAGVADFLRPSQFPHPLPIHPTLQMRNAILQLIHHYRMGGGHFFRGPM